MGLLSAFLGIKEIKCDSGKERQYTMKPNASGKCPWCGKSISGEAVQDWLRKDVYCCLRCYKKAH
ncbi:MAG: hypothetical protein IKJ56_02170 [Bacteroidales bacterium]|nr:hypothetical protein [Bacteroidales bacterium]